MNDEKTTSSVEESSDIEMLRPPVNQAMRVLDRSLFTRNIPTLAAVISDPSQITHYRNVLQRDALHMDRIKSVQPVKDGSGQLQKALILRPGVKRHGEYRRS